MERNWKPILKDKIYCSPACGANCTKKEYETAIKKAKLLAKKCSKEVGGIWDIRIWENLGWHYSVILKKGDITIYPSVSKNTYYVMAYNGGTPSPIYVSAHSSNIKRLVSLQMKEIKIEAERWNNYIEKNSKALKYGKEER